MHPRDASSWKDLTAQQTAVTLAAKASGPCSCNMEADFPARAGGLADVRVVSPLPCVVISDNYTRVSTSESRCPSPVDSLRFSLRTLRTLRLKP